MPVLPIPMIIALLLLGFLIHRLVTRETHATLLALIAACALAKRHHRAGAVLWVHGHQAAAAVPRDPHPAHCLVCLSAGLGRRRAVTTHSHRHGIAPALAVVFLLTSPMLLDVLIPLSFAGYGVAMLLRLGQGEDSLPHSRLQGGAMPLLAWRIIAVSLIASAGCDVLIAYNLAMGQNGLAPMGAEPRLVAVAAQPWGAWPVACHREPAR